MERFFFGAMLAMTVGCLGELESYGPLGDPDNPDNPGGVACGDSVCSASESCTLCASDCGACPVGGANVTLAWDAPTTREDGSPLTDLQGFRLYVDTALPVDGAGGSEVNVGNVGQFTLALAPGIHQVAVNAYDAQGLVSAYSNSLAVSVP
ncbi:MAG: hypothetical protein ACKVPX_15055 [Myxococcaceae bacterium]